MWIRIMLLLTLLAFGQQTQAQILNVEKSRLDKDTSKAWLGSASAQLNLFNRSTTAGNTFVGLVANADVSYRDHLHQYMLLNNFQYIILERASIVRTGYAHFRANWMRRKRLSYENFLQVQYDLGRGLQSRALGGGGIRYRIIHDSIETLYWGLGVMYEREQWQHPETDALIQRHIPKLSTYISTRTKVNKNFEFNAITYFQSGYDGISDVWRHRISGDLNAMLKITSRLSFRMTLWANYETKPVVPINPFIYSVTNGVMISL